MLTLPTWNVAKRNERPKLCKITSLQSALETAGKPTHQSVDDGGSAPECSWVPASTQISGSVSDVWQRCGRVVHHQRRGYQIAQTELPDDSFPKVLRPEGHQACANSPSRFTQHPGRCSLACGPDPSNRMGGFFIQCSPHGEHQWSICMWLFPTESCLSLHHHSWTRGPNTSMPCQFCGMGMVYTLPPFKMLPTVLNTIYSSHDLSVILVALPLMAASWMPELLKQSWCLPIPMEGHPLLKQEVWMPRGHVERRHYQPSNLHAWLLSGIQGISDRISTNLKAYLIGYYESHWSRFMEYSLRKCLNIFEVDSKSFSKYLLYLFEVDHYAPSTMISHWTSIASVVQHWICDPATDHNFPALLHNFHLARPIEPKMMPQWNLHLILSALLLPPFSDGPVDRPSDDVIGQKWQTLKTTLLLLLATALCVSTCLFIWGFVKNQSVLNLLSHAGFLAKNQMPDQALQWICIPGIVHLNPDEPERMLCWKSDVIT